MVKRAIAERVALANKPRLAFEFGALTTSQNEFADELRPATTHRFCDSVHGQTIRGALVKRYVLGLENMLSHFVRFESCCVRFGIRRVDVGKRCARTRRRHCHSAFRDAR
jgi:hypothetical protein